jgi:hemin uptake protein HemP
VFIGGYRLYVREPEPLFDSSNENGYHLVMESSSRIKPTLNQAPEPEMPFQRERVMSKQLLGELGELIIEHDGREYRLRRTQSGKLILTA